VVECAGKQKREAIGRGYDLMNADSAKAKTVLGIKPKAMLFAVLLWQM
jgi:hypothetical protein